MSKRKIAQVGHATVYRDAEWDEYIVMTPDQRQNPALFGDGYHTDDRDDAMDSAQNISDRWASAQAVAA